jgi:pimeloyl-ACP methyl ester carboxylesterase
MTMRMNSSKTKAFFETSKTNYIDSTIAIGENKIHYIETGNKEYPTLFFVHGSPGSWDAYKDYLKDSLLLKKYRMIAIDRPGFGYSDFRKPKNLYEQASIIEQFVEKIKNGKSIYLIGHSYGGPTIVKMAIDKPSAYKELIILAGAIDPDAETPEKWRTYFMSNPLKLIVPGAMLPANNELWWLKNDLKNMKPSLNKITANILVIHGTVDPLVPYSNVAFIEREFVNAKSMEVVSIKNANHFIPWEHYETIRNKLLTLKE